MLHWIYTFGNAGLGTGYILRNAPITGPGTAGLQLGILDVTVRVGSRPGRLTRKAEFEALAASARPSPHERDRGIRVPALGARDGLLGDSHLLGELGLGAVLVLLLAPVVATAQQESEVDLGLQAVEVLQSYLRIDTSNPPGNEAQAAAFLARHLEEAGIP